MSRSKPRVYLAGPEVFLPDPHAAAAAKKRLCEGYGLEGVFPLDADIAIKAGAPPHDVARAISLANEGLIRGCDLLIANCTPFRGASMDAGTAFEVGFMRALGRPVLGYSNVAETYKARCESIREREWDNRWDGDAADVAIEDFDLPENLMIAIAAEESGADIVTRSVPAGRLLTDLGGFEACLKHARALLAAGV